MLFFSIPDIFINIYQTSILWKRGFHLSFILNISFLSSNICNCHFSSFSLYHSKPIFSNISDIFSGKNGYKHRPTCLSHSASTAKTSLAFFSSVLISFHGSFSSAYLFSISRKWNTVSSIHLRWNILYSSLINSARKVFIYK